jgi:hypothetical protein
MAVGTTCVVVRVGGAVGLRWGVMVGVIVAVGVAVGVAERITRVPLESEVTVGPGLPIGSKGCTAGADGGWLRGAVGLGKGSKASTCKGSGKPGLAA